MADADVQITAGSGTKVDTRTVGAGTDEHRQVVVIGDDGSTKVASVVDETGSSAVDALAIGGGTPNDSVDSGNPVKIGGVASDVTPASVGVGDRVNAWYSRKGAAVIAGGLLSGADALANNNLVALPDVAGGVSAPLLTALHVFNGTTWDRLRTEAGTTGFLGVGGSVAHDAVDAGNPVKIGGKAKAAAPTDVSADADRVEAWFLRNGAQATVVTAAGALVGGDAANGLDVDVTRLPALVAGTANIGDVDVLTVPAPLSTTGGGTEATALRVTVATDSTGVLSVDDNGASLTTDAAGDIAHDGVDSGNPVKIGGYAATSIPTPVAAADRVNAWFGRSGQLIATPFTTTVSAGGDGNATLISGAFGVDGTDRPLGIGAAGYVFGTSWDRMRALDGLKTAAASPDVGVLAVAMADRRFTSVSLGTVIGNTQAWDPMGAQSAMLYVGTSTTGTFTIEVSADGTNYIAANAFNVGTEVDVSGTNITPGSGNIYRVLTTGFRSVRVKTIATLGGTVAFTCNLVSGQTLQFPQGNVAHDAVDAGNPLKIGGVASTTAPSGVTAGDRVQSWLGTSGQMVVAQGIAASAGDGSAVSVDIRPLSTGGSSGQLITAGVAFNGTSWDRIRTAPGVTGFLGVGGPTAADAAIAVAPVTIGARASTALPTAMSTDGDVVNLWSSLNGSLNVILRDTAGTYVAPSGTGGTSATDSAAWTAAATAFNPIGGAFNDSAAALTSGQEGTARLTSDRRLHIAGAGDIAHDAVDSGSPVKIGGKARAAAPTDVSADADRVEAWFLRNGAQTTVLTAAGALIGGDAANGLDVDVTRVPTDPFGANADAASATGSISAKLRFISATGIPVTSLPNVTLAAGTGTQEIVGDVAQDAAIAGNPVAIGMRASTAVPTAMSADGDVVFTWANRSGAQVIAVAPHIGLNADPFTLLSKTTQYTSAQTGVAFLTPTSGKKLVITKVQIQIGGTTSGTWILWFGGSADTTYTRGTDRAIFDGEFAPSATLKPGVVMDGPWIAGAADDILRVTGVGAINPQTVTVWYYEV